MGVRNALFSCASLFVVFEGESRAGLRCVCVLMVCVFSAVSKEDKAVIRSRLLESGLEEQEHRLALQNALVIAKIVRYEYPQDW